MTPPCNNLHPTATKCGNDNHYQQGDPMHYLHLIPHLPTWTAWPSLSRMAGGDPLW